MINKKYIKLSKKIDLYLLKSEGVSDVINILGITPEIKEIHNIYSENFLKNNKKNLITTTKVFSFIQNKFNQMVAKYLKMHDVYILNQDYVERYNLDLFLHDLIHEAIRPGSIKDFQEKNMSLDHSDYDKYNLQDFVDEDIASSLGNDTDIMSGLAVYFSEVFNIVMRNKFNKINTIEDLIKQMNNILIADIGVIINKTQKQYVLYIAKKLFNMLRGSDQAKDNVKTYNEGDYMAYLHINNLIKNYVAERNNEKLKTITHTNKRKEKIINNELVASLLRRWLIYLKNNISNIK